MKQLLQEILKGSVEEKIEAVETIWNSIDENLVPVTNEEIKIAKERHNEYLQNPDDTIDWNIARKKLMDKYCFLNLGKTKRNYHHCSPSYKAKQEVYRETNQQIKTTLIPCFQTFTFAG